MTEGRRPNPKSVPSKEDLERKERASELAKRKAEEKRERRRKKNLHQ